MGNPCDETVLPPARDIGPFSFVDGVVAGPKAYMRERGRARLRAIEEGRDPVVNHGLDDVSIDVVTLILSSLYFDYVAWGGQQRTLRELSHNKDGTS